MTFLIIVTAALLLATKFLDCWTTGRGLRRGLGEANPLVRPFMDRLGGRTVTWAVFGLSVLIVVLTGLAALRTDEAAYRAGFVSLGLAIALAQAGAAWHNQARLARGPAQSSPPKKGDHS